MADQVEVDVKVNVDKGGLDKLGDDFKKLGETGKNSFDTMDKVSKQWLNDFQGVLTPTQSRLANGWEIAKAKITSLGTTIKTKLGGAFTNVKSKFSGLINQIKSGATGAARGMGFMGSAASMAAGMIGFELFNGLVQSTRASINAAGRMQNFGKRLGMTGQDIQKFNKQCDDLQNQFKKVDMRGVGASATELGVKLGLPKERMGDLTQMIAVTSSAFVNEGRTQEDAILAVSDAMDGQFQKLKELGITQDKLKANGWNGNINDTNSLMQALNKTMDTMGFTETAKGIYTLDDAYQALTVAGGRLLADVLIPLTPIITGAVDAIINGIDGVKKVIGDLANLWNSLPDWAQIALGIGAVAVGAGMLVGYIGQVGLLAVPLIGSLISGLGTILGLIMAIEWPIVAVVAAIGLIILAFEQLGEWLGWWDSFGGMLESIKAGVLRLWNAFTNSRIVQAAIQGIVTAFNYLKSVVMIVFGWIGDAWNSLFGGTGGSNPDAIGAIIDAFTTLEDVIFTVIGALQNLWNAYMAAIAPILGNLQAIGAAIMGLFTGQTSVLEFLGTLVYNLADMWLNIASIILNAIANLFAMLLPLVVQGLAMIWQGFLDFGNLLAQLPMILMNIFIQVVATVTSWVASMIQKAATFGPQFVARLISALPSLPGKFASALGNIINVVTEWGGKLLEKAGKIISDFANTLSQGVSNAVSAITGSAGFDMGFTGDAGFSNGTLNDSLASTVSNSTASTTVNLNLKGIIDKDASTYIVDAVNDHVKTQNLIRGV